MSNIVDKMREEIIKRSNNFENITKGTKDEYNQYNEHVQYVYKYAVMLAKDKPVDMEVIELSALLHDIAMTDPKLDRSKHNEDGAIIAEKLLRENGLSEDKIELIKKCIYNHSNKRKDYRTTLEEQILVDADSLSHFDILLNIYSLYYDVMGLTEEESIKLVKEKLTKDYSEVTDEVKEIIKEKYKKIMAVTTNEELKKLALGKIEEKNIPDLNIFMMCEELNTNALSDIPSGYHLRTCRTDELELWKEFPFDAEDDKKEYKGYMTKYFNEVYEPYGDLFYKNCLFLCDENDKPVATCFAWKSYDKFYTIHWLKVLKEYEGKGLGRAILSEVMKRIPEEEYPIYLHTQPGSFRAIKLYSDFGFSILTDEYIGNRKNEYKESLTYLKHFMGSDNFSKLTFTKSNGVFSEEAKKTNVNQF